ncbi:hypothetical protein NE237_002689 [Protea cynaroides]|uniref:Beta-glucosidase n=1 Tax=Protea cynaroides TaxID=273540 RepID=A0A9Q0KFQ3_9MAGN|nr:hypothetical protein NE237_002689 [Protea cynaroides]
MISFSYTKEVTIVVQTCVFLVLGFIYVHTAGVFASNVSVPLGRSSFPEGFIFGTGSSAYQYEGAAFADGKGPSIWDTFTHRYPGKIADHSNGDVALDSYHRYKTSQKGKIGITLVSNWMEPFSTSQPDIAASHRALDFMLGWFMSPLTYGYYPRTMRTLVGDRLPEFSKNQSLMVKGSLDFLGLNYYTANYAADDVQLNKTLIISSTTDSHVHFTVSKNGTLIGAPSGAAGLYVYPRGIRELLIYTKEKYRNPVIFITENGYGELNSHTQFVQEALKDDVRTEFYLSHLSYLRTAIEDGVDVRGFFAWSLLDNFEWNSGYTLRFGINYVDNNDSLKRYPKRSAIWFKNFLRR